MKIKLLLLLVSLLSTILLVSCGERVEISPTEVGRIMTRDGYQEQTLTTSKFRLPPCFAYCDKLVKIDVADAVVTEKLKLFMPKDKLNLDLSVRGTVSINPSNIDSLFSKVVAQRRDDGSYYIEKDTIYYTYAQNLIQTTVREYITNFTIAEVASSLDKINIDLHNIISEKLGNSTPFKVRSFGVVDIKYPSIITEAQENAARRREQIQQEEAQLEISKVSLQRELQEARLKRQIEIEKAQTEAAAQKIQREVVDDRVMRLRQLENERIWIEKWDGKLPYFSAGGDSGVPFMMQMPSGK